MRTYVFRVLMGSLAMAAAGCLAGDEPEVTTAPAALVATCEKEVVAPEDDPDPEWGSVVPGREVDVSGDHVLLEMGGSTHPNPDLTDHFGGVRSYKRSASGTWAPDPANEGFLKKWKGIEYPDVDHMTFAVEGDRAVLVYHRITGPPLLPPTLGYPYQTVVELWKYDGNGYVLQDDVIIGTGLSIMHGYIIRRMPKLSVGFDGDDVVIGRTWFFHNDQAVVDEDGWATTFRVGSGGTTLIDQQALSVAAPSWRFGNEVTVRGGLVAVTEPGPAGNAEIHLFERDAGGTFQLTAVAFPILDAQRPMHVAIVNDDRFVLGVGADDGEPPQSGPVRVYERSGIFFLPDGTLPLGPGNVSPTVQTIDAAGSRVAVGGWNFDDNAPWTEVYRYNAFAQTFVLEFSSAPTDDDALGGQVALDPARLVVSKRRPWFSAVESWPIEELEANDDAYAASTTSPLVVPPAGVKANDELHCATADAVVTVAPAAGTVALSPGGGFTYTPAGLFACGDHFRYRLQGATSTSASARVDLDFDNPLCRRFYWEAYEDKPYIYKGCPDPGPEPWYRDPEIYGRPGETVDVELASEVGLRVTVLEAPANGRVMAHGHGFTWIPDAGVERSTVQVSIESGACRYQAEAQLLIAR